jgi:hypothetical protein
MSRLDRPQGDPLRHVLGSVVCALRGHRQPLALALADRDYGTVLVKTCTRCGREVDG